MESNIVLKAVRRSNRLMLLGGLVCALIVAAGFYFDRSQLVSFFSGPREMAAQELIGTTSTDDLLHNWVTVKGSLAVDTGWQEYTESDSGDKTINSSYAALTVGKHFLLIQIPGEIDQKTLPQTYTGALVNIPTDVNDQIMTDIRSQDAKAAAEFLPIMLDTADYRSAAIVPLILVILGGIGTLVLFYMGVRRSINPLRHPFMKALRRYGDPTALSQQITQEMAAPHTQVAKNIHITPHWLVFNPGGGFQAAQLQDVVWAYQKIIQRRAYGIKAGKTFQAEVWDQQGKMLSFTGKQNNVLAGLQAIVQAAPWAIIGYSADLDKQWRKSRAEFLAGVQQRRAQ